jgi:hypothetical protein
MAQLLRKNLNKSYRSDEIGDLWGYGPDVEPTAIEQRTSKYNKQAIKNGWLLLQSTVHYSPYLYEDVADNRRKPKKP